MAKQLPVGDNFQGHEAMNEFFATIDTTGGKLGFFGKTPIAKPAAIADTSGATLAALETEVNKLKQLFRNYGLLT